MSLGNDHLKKKVKTVVVYAARPIGMIVGEFDIEKIIEKRTDILWEETHRYAGISKNFFDSYYSNCDVGVAIKIKNPKLYEHPIPLNELLPNALPPQSYRYILS